MFLEERQEAILNLLSRDGKVRVKDLSEMFKVTEDCIRKDLGALEKQGKLKRTYGGAVVRRENLHMLEVSKHRSSMRRTWCSSISRRATSRSPSCS